MKRMIPVAAFAVMSLLLTGCLTPVKTELSLAGGDLSVRATNPNETRLVIFNDSNTLWYGLDGSGRINVQLDGKGVAQIKIHRYAQLITTRGRHRVDLVHFDLVKFRSHHEIDLTGPESFLRINATPTGHEVRIVPALPPGFAQEFQPVN